MARAGLRHATEGTDRPVIAIDYLKQQLSKVTIVQTIVVLIIFSIYRSFNSDDVMTTIDYFHVSIDKAIDSLFFN